MVKPAGQKRWMAPGALRGPSEVTRARHALLGGPLKALLPAPPAKTSPSSRSVEGEPRAASGLLWGVRVVEPEPGPWGSPAALSSEWSRSRR